MLAGKVTEILFSRFAYKSQCRNNVCLFSDLVLISLNWAPCHMFSIVISYRRSNLRNVPAEIFKFHTSNSGKTTPLKIISIFVNIAMQLNFFNFLIGIYLTHCVPLSVIWAQMSKEEPFKLIFPEDVALCWLVTILLVLLMIWWQQMQVGCMEGDCGCLTSPGSRVKFFTVEYK